MWPLWHRGPRGLDSVPPPVGGYRVWDRLGRVASTRRRLFSSSEFLYMLECFAFRSRVRDSTLAPRRRTRSETNEFELPRRSRAGKRSVSLTHERLPRRATSRTTFASI